MPFTVTPATFLRSLMVAGALAALCGCQTKILPDPNDPATVTAGDRPDAIHRLLSATGNTLGERLAKREIDESQFESMKTDYAASLVKEMKVDPTKVDPAKAWEVGDAYRAAKEWSTAAEFFKISVPYAKKRNDYDRFVNDSLWLAECQCHLKKVPDAIENVRATFDSPPAAKAPILTGTLLCVVPAGEGQGDDVQLGKLLQDAVGQSMQTIVDPKTDAGKSFLIARTVQVRNALGLAVDLFRKAGRSDLANAAEQRRLSQFS
ncbi:MAG TPA: hypothetical protein VG944_13925 [Fimbriimonas sp.]|nr:hypothetical protein [Fimbriimonas sp.]